ncbi:2,4-dienoyl-CoA reductase [Nitrosomonas ureae]|uniref:2,4-dienoyl-CoA reductase n=1 Tax=Nitrosomonas ureae TaxID=44577 RepID=A0A1H5VTH4_9PROT|nr:2,4-dienoyl-CoA reductase [Nitrosomonas ureae]
MSDYEQNNSEKSAISKTNFTEKNLPLDSAVSLGQSVIQTIDEAQCHCEHDREIPQVDLLTALTIRGVTFRNRIAMSPMCMYSAQDGFATDFHLVHLGSRAMGGAGLVVVEATAVTPEGRISPGDTGIWKDEHIEPLARIARFVEAQGSVPGIQLAHAGRKASCDSPWSGGRSLETTAEGGWPVVGPSPLPFDKGDPVPIALSKADIEQCINAWEAGTRRALIAGFKVIELHAAHGYLLHEFLSPISNHRNDDYGGSLENRMRFLLRVAERLRNIIPQQLPLFVRISATDWVDGGWDIEQSVVLSRRLKELGVDLIDVSSGGTTLDAKIPVAKGYQIPFARRIREETGICTGGVGLITDQQYADEIITSGEADIVFLGRELLREPYWAIKAQQFLGGEPTWPIQYGYAVKRRAK